MDPELTNALTTLVGILVGGGGLYGINRLRNGNGAQPQQDASSTIPPGGADAATMQGHFVLKSACDAHHAEITEGLRRGGDKMDTLSGQISELTVEVRSRLSEASSEAEKVARAESRYERENHEKRWHDKG